MENTIQAGIPAEESTAFEVVERICASTPDRHHYLIMQAVNQESKETVWAIGDDSVCAITRADFIRNQLPYNSVLIQEFPYRDYSPDSVGQWKPLIQELSEFTLGKYLEKDGLVHLYPQWTPEGVYSHLGKELFDKMCEDTDHIILYDNYVMDFVSKHEVEQFQKAKRPSVQAAIKNAQPKAAKKTKRHTEPER